jgi:hypothetical protein
MVFLRRTRLVNLRSYKLNPIMSVSFYFIVPIFQNCKLKKLAGRRQKFITEKKKEKKLDHGRRLPPTIVLRKCRALGSFDEPQSSKL